MTTQRASRRERQAAETRRDILMAARRLFATRGYSATTIADIAQEAGTAIQTIYASVGSKPTIVRALNDLIDEEAEVPSFGRRFGATDDPAELIRLAVRLTRQISERCGDILGVMLSTTGELAVAEAVADGQRRHREGTHRVAARLAQLGALQPGLSTERAGDTLALLTSVQAYQLLTQSYGWSFDDCEAWMSATLATLLLGEQGDGRGAVEASER